MLMHSVVMLYSNNTRQILSHIFLSPFQVSYLVMFAYISLTLGDTTHLSSIYISSKVLTHFLTRSV